jgi:chitin synthase
MYRLYTGELQPLLARDSIFRAYARNDITSLHERNLYDLGEDRLLTTLMLEEFHTMQLCFVPEAICWTIVPHTFQMLQRQRRRWINSGLHNMFELLKLETMCGVCLFSMKMVVIFDIVSTFLLPPGCVYLYYIVVEAFLNYEPLSPLQYVAFGCVGVMTLPFVFRAQWDYFLWFFVFLIGGIPVFYFYLPMYAFWHMDDFSWWDTRHVQPGKKSAFGGANPESTEPLEKLKGPKASQAPRTNLLAPPQ